MESDSEEGSGEESEEEEESREESEEESNENRDKSEERTGVERESGGRNLHNTISTQMFYRHGKK